MENIITEPTMAPEKNYTWMAYRDSFDIDLVGHGETEQQAI